MDELIESLKLIQEEHGVIFTPEMIKEYIIENIDLIIKELENEITII